MARGGLVQHHVGSEPLVQPLQAGGHVGGVPHGREGLARGPPDVSDDHLPRCDADPGLEGGPSLALPLLVHPVHLVEDLLGRHHGPQGVVLAADGEPVDDHQGVSHVFVAESTRRQSRRRDALEVLVELGDERRRVRLFGDGGEPLDVGVQDGGLDPLALQVDAPRVLEEPRDHGWVHVRGEKVPDLPAPVPFQEVVDEGAPPERRGQEQERGDQQCDAALEKMGERPPEPAARGCEPGSQGPPGTLQVEKDGGDEREQYQRHPLAPGGHLGEEIASQHVAHGVGMDFHARRVGAGGLVEGRRENVVGRLERRPHQADFISEGVGRETLPRSTSPMEWRGKVPGPPLKLMSFSSSPVQAGGRNPA